jgi:hypothetical protein
VGAAAANNTRRDHGALTHVDQHGMPTFRCQRATSIGPQKQITKQRFEDTNVGIMRKRLSWLAALATIATAAAAALPFASQATTVASVTLSAGGFALINGTPAATISFTTVTLNGASQTVTAPLAVDIGDATGSGSGWNVTATSTTFTSGANTLPTTATTIQSAPTASCDTGATGCTTATTTVSYPYKLPAATVAPTATRLFNAIANTGVGNQTFTPTWTLAIPANAVASTTAYTSTWTFSLVSGP